MKKITIKRLENLLKQPESDYLDFKRNYSTNSDLIIDLLALANSQSNKKNRFLIFGITDRDHEPCHDLESSKNRKKQADIIDLLRNIPVNRIPIFKLYTLKYREFEIDILHIKNTSEQPYFLIKKFTDKNKTTHTDKSKTIEAGTIYIRVGDTNRPASNDTELDAIYRRRFGLDRKPLERFVLYLKDIAGWNFNNNEQEQLYFYYEQHPEFIVLLPDSTEIYIDCWTKDFPDPNNRKQIFYLKYHSTLLQYLVGAWVDGMRYLNVTPECYREQKPNNLSYVTYYFIENSIQLLLNNMIQIYFTKNISKGTIYQKLFFPSFKSPEQAKNNFKKDLLKKDPSYCYCCIKNKKSKTINGHKKIERQKK